MKDFDIVIIGGGCSGLSLAYQLEINSKLKGRSLAIIDNRDRYFRDKTWSFWKVNQHDFEDCVIKSWKQFSINSKDGTLYKDCNKYPYQSIDSGLFYDKILNKLKQNKNIVTIVCVIKIVHNCCRPCRRISYLNSYSMATSTNIGKKTM